VKQNEQADLAQAETKDSLHILINEAKAKIEQLKINIGVLIAKIERGRAVQIEDLDRLRSDL
jgi:hypothetical protein